MRRRPLFEGQHTVGHHYSDSEADQWAPHVLTFSKFWKTKWNM
jgi:hypothetical protein